MQKATESEVMMKRCEDSEGSEENECGSEMVNLSWMLSVHLQVVAT